MSKIMYNSNTMKNIILPSILSSYKELTSAYSQARRISFSIEMGFSEVCNQLEKEVSDMEKFLKWSDNCMGEFQNQVDGNIEIISKIPSTEVLNRDNSVNKM